MTSSPAPYMTNSGRPGRRFLQGPWLSGCVCVQACSARRGLVQCAAVMFPAPGPPFWAVTMILNNAIGARCPDRSAARGLVAVLL